MSDAGRSPVFADTEGYASNVTTWPLAMATVSRDLGTTPPTHVAVSLQLPVCSDTIDAALSSILDFVTRHTISEFDEASMDTTSEGMRSSTCFDTSAAMLLTALSE